MFANVVAFTLQALDEARFYVNEANNSLNLAINKTLKYNILPYVSNNKEKFVIFPLSVKMY